MLVVVLVFIRTPEMFLRPLRFVELAEADRGGDSAGEGGGGGVLLVFVVRKEAAVVYCLSSSYVPTAITT
jgi:hypothetical protein